MSRRQRSFRPTLEVLEDRSLPSVAGRPATALVPPQPLPAGVSYNPAVAVGRPAQGNAGWPGTITAWTAADAALASFGAALAPGAYLSMIGPTTAHVAWTINTSGEGAQQLASPMLWGTLS
jgi:hypothetical protein